MELSAWYFIETETPIHERQQRDKTMSLILMLRGLEQRSIKETCIEAIKVVMVEDNEKRWIRGRELL
ncbi:hypothetical protein HID58_090362 [Brassica napus]|uniref:Uncharacterized protein n=2 Tax=Brassica TaxID=3705 RepID=A0ABQ7X0C5_BRANA|nr:hypothetical protein HID58_090362 [Brassica napus]CAG7875121.1 unnamed protein product [Brassica rapa]VDC70793.1 unnamed protein product [Brassica rapa]